MSSISLDKIGIWCYFSKTYNKDLLWTIDCSNAVMKLKVSKLRLVCIVIQQQQQQQQQGKFDEFISPDEGLFERNM